MGTELLTGSWLCQGYWPQTQETWDLVPLDPSPEALLGICHIQCKDYAENTNGGRLSQRSHCWSGMQEQHILRNTHTLESTHVDTPNL